MRFSSLCTCGRQSSLNDNTESAPPLIDLDGGVYLPDEEEGGEESDGAGDEPEGDGDDDGVDEIDEGGDEVVDVELRVEVKDAVGEHVDRGAPGDGEGAPPPVVVFRAELEVDHDDADLRAGHDEDDEDQEEEPEEVVELKWRSSLEKDIS